MTATSRSCRGVLHPLWWAALALLLLNDHFLKGTELLPGWLTGKLSDFAGLIVAPVLVTAVLRARGARSRAACCAAVGFAFAAVKLSPAVARAAEAGLALLSGSSRIWSDPTDLSALVVLPLSWHLARPVVRTSVERRGLVRTWERGAVIAGAVACLATSKIPDVVELNLYLANATRSTVTAALLRAMPPLDCAALASGDHTSLAAAVFSPASCLSLDPLVDTMLGHITIVNSGGVDSGTKAACQAVVIRAAGLDDTVLFWLASHAADASERPNPAHAYIESAGAMLYLDGSPYIQAFPADFPVPPSGCAGAP